MLRFKSVTGLLLLLLLLLRLSSVGVCVCADLLCLFACLLPMLFCLQYR
jgi:hypothetical protein